MSSTSFHWFAENITPNFKRAVGSIVLSWAMIDADLSRTALLFWQHDHPNERKPARFARRVRFLLDFAAALYVDEPDEHLLFKWYVQRLRTVGGHRDNIAHGIPGTITRGKRSYQGLWVPSTFGPDNYVPMKISELGKFALELEQMHFETIGVTAALWAAQVASSPNKQFRQVDGVWTQITRENRSPRLPRFVPLPPTFLG